MVQKPRSRGTRASKGLKEAEEKYRRLVEDINDGYAVIQEDGRVVFANKRCAEIFGYELEEIVGQPFEKFLAPELVNEALEMLERIIDTEAAPERYETAVVNKEGIPVPVEASLRLIWHEGRLAVSAITRDITERKRAEEERAFLYQQIKDKAERMTVTAELTRIIGSSLNISDVYDAFVAGVKRLVGFDRASIALAEGDKLRFLAVSSAVETELKEGTTVPLEGTATAWVMESKRTNIETDFALSMQFPIDEAHLKSGLRSAIRLPLFSRGDVFGTFNLSSRHPNAYGEREQDILEELAGQIAVAIENDRLFAEVKGSKEELEATYHQLVETAGALENRTQELEDAYLKMARTLVLTLEARDPYTRGHSERVAQLARQMAFELGLSQEEMRQLETAARLHDLGKIGIPDGILLKPGPITPSERAEVQLHPTKAVSYCASSVSSMEHCPSSSTIMSATTAGAIPTALKGKRPPSGRAS